MNMNENLKSLLHNFDVQHQIDEVMVDTNMEDGVKVSGNQTLASPLPETLFRQIGPAANLL